MRRLSCLFAAALSVTAFSTHAQLSSDQVPQSRVLPVKESVERQMTESRWRFGPLRVDPAIKLANLGYNDNVFSTEDEKFGDYTATVGLGIRTLVPIGSKTFLRVDAVPEYTWYNELEERREFGWEAGGSLLGLYNRLQIEAGGKSGSTVANVNSEDSVPVPQQTDRIFAGLEVELVRRVFLFAAAIAESSDYDPPADGDPGNFNLLDRDEDLERVGVRYQFRPNVSLSAMYERTSAEFPNDPVFSSNEGDATLLGVSYDAERFYVNLVGGKRSIEYEGGGAPKFDEWTGSGYVSLRMLRRSQVSLSFRRKPVYSTFVENPFFYETRTGIFFDVAMGQRFIVLAGYENGTNDYQAPIEVEGGSTIFRQDDVDTWRAGLGFRVARFAVLQLEYKVDDYQSNVPGFSREIGSLGVNLVLR